MATIRQFLRRKIYEGKYLFVDFWSIAHVILFFFIGVFYPNRWKLVIVGMIAFELFERVLSKKALFLKESTKDTLNDIFFNIVGYWLGQQYLNII